MKKFLVLFLALSVVGGAAFAQESTATIGAELNFRHLNTDPDVTTHFRPFFNVEATELGPGFDLFAEVGVNFYFDDETATSLDFEFDFAYNIAAGEGTLTFGLNFDSNGFGFSYTYYDSYFGLITGGFSGSRVAPRLRYTLEGDMTLFGQLEMGFLFDTYSGWSYTELGANIDMNLSGGMAMGMDSGIFGLEATLYMFLQIGGSSPDDTLHALTLLPSFTFSDTPLHIEMEIGIPLWEDAMDNYGIWLIPELRFGLSETTEVWLNLPMWHVTGDPDLHLGLGLGIQFSF